MSNSSREVIILQIIFLHLHFNNNNNNNNMFYFYSAFQEPKVTLQNNTSNWQT